MRRPLAAWQRLLIRASLRAWPAGARERMGPGAIESAERTVAERRGRLGRAWTAVAESAALVRAGASLRRRRGVDRERGPEAPLAGLVQDLRFAVRTLLRAPGFTAVAVLTLGVGIGVNGAVFSLVDGALLTDPAYEEPERLVTIWNTLPGGTERLPVAGPDVGVMQERARTLSDVAFTIRGVDSSIDAGDGSGVDHVRLASVTPTFFEVLGVQALLGRTFRADDAATFGGDETVLTGAVLSHEVWQRLLGGDPGVVGRNVRLSGLSARVVGIMPPGFTLALPPGAGVATDVDVWISMLAPLSAFHREERLLDQDSDNTGAAIGRLADGVSLTAAQEEVARIGRELQAEVPMYAESGLGLEARPLVRDATADVRPLLLALLAGVALVLVVACANLATLLIARGMGRRREMAVRVALGAPRVRLVRQLAVENALLVAAGTAVALALAGAVTATMGGWVPPALTGGRAPTLDPTTLLLLTGIAAATTLALGVASGVQALAASSGGWATASGSRGDVGGAGRARSLLVVFELALAVVLLVSAGLLWRTVGELHAVEPGFDPADRIAFDVSLRVPERFRGPGRRAEVMSAVAEAVADLPGVEAVGWVGALPLSGERWTQPYGPAGSDPSTWGARRADFRMASSGWFDAMGTRLLAGRVFTPEEDRVEVERVVVVDETVARELTPSGDAVGLSIGVPVDGAPVTARIVGVVEHVRYESLEREGRGAIYVPYRQEASREVSFVAHTAAGRADAVLPLVRDAVRSVDDQVPVYGLRTLEDYVRDAVAPRRFALDVVAVFALLAAGCAGFGLYGALAFEVRRRTREIGVRLAIGADRARVVRGVVGDGLRLAVAGLVLGAGLALAGTRVLEGLVVGVTTTDPATWAGALATVLVLALAASWLPARTASRLEPTVALRAD